MNYFSPSDRPMLSTTHEEDALRYRKAASCWMDFANERYNLGYYEDSVKACELARDCVLKADAAQMCAEALRAVRS